MPLGAMRCRSSLSWRWRTALDVTKVWATSRWSVLVFRQRQAVRKGAEQAEVARRRSEDGDVLAGLEPQFLEEGSSRVACAHGARACSRCYAELRCQERIVQLLIRLHRKYRAFVPPSRVQGESPAIPGGGFTRLPKDGAGNPWFPPGVRGCPPVLENVGGRSGRDSGADQARPSAEGGRTPQQDPPSRLCRHPLAKYERLCYSILMKWAGGPLLLLGACRITYVLGANHRESPCGRGAEGTPQGARPSEEGWDRSACRCKAQALWSHPAP